VKNAKTQTGLTTKEPKKASRRKVLALGEQQQDREGHPYQAGRYYTCK